MIAGYYNGGRPSVLAQLEIPCVGKSGPIVFVADTGADETVLLPNEARLLGVDYKLLEGQPRHDALGLGGNVSAFSVPATVTLRSKQYLFRYAITLRIIEFDLDNEWLLDLPSILGRDILNRTTATFDHPKLAFEPKDWDYRDRR